MILFIDTTDQESANLALISGSKTVHRVFKVNHNLSEILVPEIKKFLAGQKIRQTDLKKIGVVVGPGHFSKVRTAVAVANAMAYGLKIPVAGVKSSEKPDWPKFLNRKGSSMVKPLYDREPHITVSKKIA